MRALFLLAVFCLLLAASCEAAKGDKTTAKGKVGGTKKPGTVPGKAKKEVPVKEVKPEEDTPEADQPDMDGPTLDDTEPEVESKKDSQKKPEDIDEDKKKEDDKVTKKDDVDSTDEVGDLDEGASKDGKEEPEVDKKPEEEVVPEVPQELVPPVVNVTEYVVTDEVWFEVKIKGKGGNDVTGRFVVALFGELLPLTTLNFVSLARGYQSQGNWLTYKKSVVHRVVQDFVIQMGDITESDGTGGMSIFGYHFHDEHFGLKHRGAGWVAMANRGRNTNMSQFYIMLTKARWLDGKNVVFGKVVRGFDVLDTIAAVKADSETGKPRDLVLVNDCGLTDSPRYKLPLNMLDSIKDYHPEL